MSFHFDTYKFQRDLTRREFNKLTPEEFTYSRDLLFQDEVDFVNLGSPVVSLISQYIAGSRIFLEDILQTTEVSRDFLAGITFLGDFSNDSNYLTLNPLSLTQSKFYGFRIEGVRKTKSDEYEIPQLDDSFVFERNIPNLDIELFEQKLKKKKSGKRRTKIYRNLLDECFTQNSLDVLFVPYEDSQREGSLLVRGSIVGDEILDELLGKEERRRLYSVKSPNFLNN